MTSRSRPPSAGMATAAAVPRRGVGGHGPSLLRPSVVFARQRLHVGVGGCAAFYSAALTCAPEAPVTLSPCNLPTSLRVTPSLQVFTVDNWSTPQWFRVAAVGGTAFENDTPLGVKDDRRQFVHVVDHTTNSMDARFHALKPGQLIPGPVVVHVSPRDGGCVVHSGRELGIAKHVGKGTVNASHHDFRPIEFDPLPLSSAVSTRLAMVSGVSRTGRVASSRRTTQATVDADVDAVAPSLSSVDGRGHTYLKIACRKNQTVLLQRNGCVVTLGKREMSDASSGSPTPSTTTVDTNADDSAHEAALRKMLVDVDCGDDHVVALTEHGYMLTWGEGKDGRLGHGDELSRPQPRLLKALLHKRITQIACGGRHTLALAEDGDVYAWGDGRCGALGLAMSPQSKAVADDSVLLPMEVLTLRGKSVVRLACGDMHSAAVLSNGALLTCGWAEHGRLGRPTTTSEFSSCFQPVDLDGERCTYVACGGAHTLALTAGHHVVAFGSNDSGQLGVGDLRRRFTPTRLAYFDFGLETNDPGALMVISLTAGKLHSMALTQDRRVFAWGSDEFGQCGVGSFPQLYTVPHLVPSAAGLGTSQLAGGDSHSVLLCQLAQHHLDGIEATHPARYAAMMNRFEQSVWEDKARRAVVLRAAKQKQQTHEAAVRQRKPPVDPSTKRAAHWQSQLEATAVAATHIVASGSPSTRVRTTKLRPQTASTGSHSTGAKPTMRPSTGRARSPRTPTTVTSPVKVRCSSATLWRHTRLFTFQAPPAKADSDDSTTAKPRGMAATGIPRQQLKLTVQARKALGRLYNGEDQDGKASQVRGTTRTSVAAGGNSEQLAPFPPSRPKSATKVS